MLLLLLLACTPEPATSAGSGGDSGAGDAGSGDGSGDGGVEPADCTPVGFDQDVILYTLPDALSGYNADWVPFPDLFGAEDCPGGSYSYSFEDLDGDDRVELALLLDDCGTVPRGQLGVFPAGRTGFAETATAYALPDAVAGYTDHSNAGWHTFGACDDAGQDYQWGRVDLTGDGRLDIVIFFDECRDDELGRSYWEVYAGGEDGFADEALRFELPTAYAGYAPDFHPFASTLSTAACPDGDGYARFMLEDLTGDGVPDLVLVYDECGDPAVGASIWQLYAGTGTSFEADPVTFTLPPGFDDYNPDGHPFYASQGLAGCDATGTWHYSYSLLDLTGDGIQDLVLHFADCSPTWGGGDTEWLVYEGSPTGFATERTSFPLPPAMASYRATGPVFPALTARDSCSSTGKYYSYGSFDITADGFPDLVVFYDECLSDEIGATRWLVHPGSPEGFAEDAVSFALPEEMAAYGPGFHPIFDVAGETSCDTSGAPYGFTVMDLSGDGLPDLVVHFDQCRGSLGLGRDAWALYPGVCPDE